MQTLLIYYPHLFLFVYNLRENQDLDEVSLQQQSWEDLRTRLQVTPEADANPERNYPIAVEDLEGVIGFYQRYPLGDTDSLLVSCCTKDKDTPQNINCLYDFREKLEAQGNIGKTWLILGYLNSASEVEHEKAAKQAYKGFKKTETDPTLKPGNYFLGGSIFEVWNPPQDWANLKKDENETVLICICPYKKTVERFGGFYYELLLLLYYRHKILWTYSQSRIIKKMLAKEDIWPHNSRIAEITVPLPNPQLIEENFEILKKELHKNTLDFAKHTAGLESLGVQLQTMRNNINNFQKRLGILKEKAIEEIGITKLKCLEDFGEFIAPRYQAQIEQDYAILAPGLRVREKCIDTIRGFVEIDRASRDRLVQIENRNFQNAVAFVGVGIGTATFTATALTPLVQEITKPTPIETTKTLPATTNTCLTWVIFLFLCIAVGLACGWGAYTWLVRSRRPPLDR